MAAPLVENPKLEGIAREMVMASSRMGAGFHRKHFYDCSDQEFEQNFTNARMDMHDTLFYLRMLIEECPDNDDLKNIEMKAKGFYVFLGGQVDVKAAG